jgi:ribosomal protein S14
MSSVSKPSGADLERKADITISRGIPRSCDMDDLILKTVFDEDMMDILPPERDTCPKRMMSRCDCCGRPAAIDEDCCGICEDCLLA